MWRFLIRNKIFIPMWVAPLPLLAYSATDYTELDPYLLMLLIFSAIPAQIAYVRKRIQIGDVVMRGIVPLLLVWIVGTTILNVFQFVMGTIA